MVFAFERLFCALKRRVMAWTLLHELFVETRK